MNAAMLKIEPAVERHSGGILSYKKTKETVTVPLAVRPIKNITITVNASD